MKAPADEVFELLHEVFDAYRARRQQAIAAAGQPVSHLEASTIAFFGRRPGATLSDLAVHSGRDKSQLARLIAGLRERGLIEAHEDEADRRSVRLRLTPPAEAMFHALRQELRKVKRMATADLSQAEYDKLMECLARMRARLQDA